MTTDEAYRILGVAPGAGPKEVQAAYRNQAMQCHPDKARTEAQSGAYTRRFMEVRNAYEYLRQEGFPVPETEEVLYDVYPDLPPMAPAGRSFVPKKKDALADVSLSEKLGFSFSVDLESFSLWGVIIPVGAITVVLFIRYLLRVLVP